MVNGRIIQEKASQTTLRGIARSRQAWPKEKTTNPVEGNPGEGGGDSKPAVVAGVRPEAKVSEPRGRI